MKLDIPRDSHVQKYIILGRNLITKTMRLYFTQYLLT